LSLKDKIRGNLAIVTIWSEGMCQRPLRQDTEKQNGLPG
jgi:hypothetical protein